MCAFLLLARSSHICSQLARAPHDRRSTWAGGVGVVVVVVDFPRMKSPSTSRRTTGMYDPNRHCWSSDPSLCAPAPAMAMDGGASSDAIWARIFCEPDVVFFLNPVLCSTRSLRPVPPLLALVRSIAPRTAKRKHHHF